MIFRYNKEKDDKLGLERNIRFDDIITELYSESGVLKIINHPNQENYPNQKIAYVELLDEVYAIPFIIEADGSVFLKTVYPSRKARKLLLGSSNKVNRSGFIEAINSGDNK